jgi:anthranilate synthase component 2
VHGKTSAIYHNDQGLFAGMPNPFQATRYHSLVIDRATCPPDLEITAWTEDGLIMGVRHRRLPIAGVQFHPESIMTEGGKRLLQNYLDMLG